MKTFCNRFQIIGEYIVAAIFIFGSINLIGMAPLVGDGFIIRYLGGAFALHFYTVLFMFLGLGLIFSKVFKRKRVHKNMLLGMYLTTIYTTLLTMSLFGVTSLGYIDDVLMGLLTAWWWLRWKFHTEYFDPTEWDSARYDLDRPREP